MSPTTIIIAMNNTRMIQPLGRENATWYTCLTAYRTGISRAARPNSGT